MTPFDASPTAAPPGCVAYRATLNRVLDGDLPPVRLADGHTAGCPECAGMASLARGLLQATPVVTPLFPDQLADQIVVAAVRDRRRRRLAWAGSSALVAAGVLAAGYLALPRPANPDRPEVARAPAVTPAPRVGDQLQEAGAALASLTRTATEPVTAPVRLLPQPEVVSFANVDPPAVEPAADALAGMPSAAKAGLEPMTSTARRAVNLFLRDTGLAAGKPKL
ncbi:MAG: hypothetical protein U0871_11805 [Gemmataceae bacterium]